MRNVPSDRQDIKIQLSFDICYIIKSVQGLVELRCSWLLESSFLPHGIKNGQLLLYGHAYQLSICANVKTKQKRSHLKTIVPLLYAGADMLNYINVVIASKCSLHGLRAAPKSCNYDSQNPEHKYYH